MRNFIFVLLSSTIFLSMDSVFADRYDRAYLRGARHIHHHDEDKHSHRDHLLHQGYEVSNYWSGDWPTGSLGLGYETTHTQGYVFNPYYYYNGVHVTPTEYYQELYDYYYENEDENNPPEYYFVPVPVSSY